MAGPRQDAGSRLISTGEAALRLGVSPETIRRWVDDRVLEGFSEPRKLRRRYFVNEDAVEKRQRRRETAEPRPGEELRRLRRRVEELEAAIHAPQRDELGRERDHYRAENSALKEALLRLNAAMEHMEQAASEHAAALREQREALSVLLTPHSPGVDLRSGPP